MKRATTIISLAAASIFALSLAVTSGCTSASRHKIGNWAASTDARVTCYSGGKLIYEGMSTGKIISEANSDGYAFVDKKDGVLKEVSGNCVISYEGR